MRVKQITVNNYRLLQDFKIDLEKNLSLIVGKNNSGKTSLLRLLDDFLNKDQKHFSFDDFSLATRSRLYEDVIGKSGIDINYSFGLRLKLYLEYFPNDSLAPIEPFLMNLDPDENVVVIGFEYIVDNVRLKKLQTDYKKYNSSKDIECSEGLFNEYMLQESTRYFLRHTRVYEFNDEDNFREIRSFKEIKRLIQLQVIRAKRAVDNADGILAKDGDNTLSKLTGKYYENQRSTDKTPEEMELDRLIDETNKKYTTQYAETFSDLLEKIREFGGMMKGDSKLLIESMIKAENLLRTGTTVKYVQNERYLPESYNGLGYMNLIELIVEIEMKIRRFKMGGVNDATPAAFNLLFIEEPEAHTHPQMQYIFIKNIERLLDDSKKEKGKDILQLQTLISTHSSHIVANCNFSDIKYFYKNSKDSSVSSKNLSVLEKEYGEKSKEYMFLQKYLTLTRAEFFFAEKIILIEGDTERILLPAFMHKVDLGNKEGTPLLSQHISIVEIGTNAKIFRRFFKFLNISKTLVITDIDYGKNNAKGKITSCKLEEANLTSNPTLKDFFGSNELITFQDMSFETKQQKLNEEDPESGEITTVFQTKNGDDWARSFEDAFFGIPKNKSFVIKNREDFTGLKNRSSLIEEKSAYDIADKCVNKKTDFALDIVFLSDKNYSEWDIPNYINEGLEWLKK